jgi:hypothetical protein
MKLFNLKKFKITHKGLYWGLIITFALLYLCVGFVSTLHSITFFGLANSIGLAILLGLTYEVGQASVLFSILMTRNKDKFLPWALMFLLTALQVTANVYASFKFMANSGSNDWTYWQKSILFGVQAANPEMYQVIISWIAGALLPVVALGMTALVAQNIKLMTEEDEAKSEQEKPEEEKEMMKRQEIFVEEPKKEEPKFSLEEPVLPSREEQLEKFKEKVLSNIGKQTKLEENPILGEGGVEIIKPDFKADLQRPKWTDSEGVEWDAKPTDIVGNLTSKIPFKLPDYKPELPLALEKLDEIVENEVQRRLKEEREKITFEKVKDALDEEAERLIPEINLPIETKVVNAEITPISPDIIIEKEEPEILIEEETLKEAEKAIIEEVKKTEIPEVALDIQTTTTEAGLFKTDSEGELKKVPLTKTRGWHLKKEYVDSNGDVYHFGKFSPQEKRDKPEEPKKA